MVVRLRYLILVGWAVAAVAAVLYLPALTSDGQDIGDLVPANAPALKAEIASLRAFSVPVLSRIAIVQRDPHGLTPAAQARVFERALRIDTKSDPAARGIAGAIPITNTLGLFPGSNGRSTTAITYLFFGPDVSIQDQVTRAHAFERAEIRQPADSLIGLTGPIPAQVEQSDLILRWLPLVEAATILVIALIVGLYFRAIGPPLLTLAAAGVGYLVSVRVVAWAGRRLGVVLFEDLEPVLVVLILGVVTDYSIFFLSGFRLRLGSGEPRLRAAQRTTADFVPIIFTAGLIVAAGTAALLAASLGFLRAFGAALAFTVVVSLLVSITLTPAALAIFGRALFLPGRPATRAETETSEHATAQLEGKPTGWRARVARGMTYRPVAALVALICVAVLAFMASGLGHTRLGFTLISGLPQNTDEARAAAAAGEGFAPGILSPTEILVQGNGLADQGAGLSKLRGLLQQKPGVAGVIGPSPALDKLRKGLMVSPDGRAARFVLILSQDPLGGRGISILHGLGPRLPALLGEAGLGNATAGLAGDTALADDAVHQMFHDLLRVALAALLVDLLLLVLFLRGVVAPLYLLATSVLALAAALGVTTYLFQVWLGHGELTYYVPFGAAVLLVSLGSDYNVFVVGRIWEEARARPLRDAIAVAAPRAARTITIAGVVLAASFGVLALIPVVQFRELAFVMAVGVLLDSFVVRSLLVPSLISLFGRVSWWPGRGFRMPQKGVAARHPRPVEHRAAS